MCTEYIRGRADYALSMNFCYVGLNSRIFTIMLVCVMFRILEAKQAALWIGVQNFHHSPISCACVVFVEIAVM